MTECIKLCTQRAFKYLRNLGEELVYEYTTEAVTLFTLNTNDSMLVLMKNAFQEPHWVKKSLTQVEEENHRLQGQQKTRGFRRRYRR